MDRIELYQGDITQLEADVIVNAANTTLLGGGGVDGAIHRAAGPGLLEECKTLGGCAVGEAKVTSAYNLPCKFVIHTVGPVWKGGNANEPALLESCYRNSLRIAANMKLRKIAIPNISTGVYGYPKDQAAEIAISTVRNFLEGNRDIEKVIFAVFDAGNYEIYKQKLAPENA
jgi:O-acetyl-ADP-ribose deacetylase (regulator of RNase III)